MQAVQERADLVQDRIEVGIIRVGVIGGGVGGREFPAEGVNLRADRGEEFAELGVINNEMRLNDSLTETAFSKCHT